MRYIHLTYVYTHTQTYNGILLSHKKDETMPFAAAWIDLEIMLSEVSQKKKDKCHMKANVAQLCLTLCDPMDCSPPGASVHGDSPGRITGVGCHALLQGIFPTQESKPNLPHCRQILYHLSHQRSSRILEWVAYPFSRGSPQPRNQTGVSCIAGRFFTS